MFQLTTFIRVYLCATRRAQTACGGYFLLTTDGHRYWMELGIGSVAAPSSSVFICVHLWLNDALV